MENNLYVMKGRDFCYKLSKLAYFPIWGGVSSYSTLLNIWFLYLSLFHYYDELTQIENTYSTQILSWFVNIVNEFHDEQILMFQTIQSVNETYIQYQY